MAKSTAVLLVTDIFPPDIGGPATFIDTLAHRLVEKGMRPTVVCRTARPTRKYDAERPFAVRRATLPGPLRAPAPIPVLAAEMLRHPVVLVNGLEIQAYWAARLARRRYMLKVVGDIAWEAVRLAGISDISIDDFQRDPPDHPLARKLIARRLAFVVAAARVVTPSEYLRQMVIGWGKRPEDVVVVRNGAEPGAIAGSVRPRAEGEKLRLAFAGRLVNWKGVETLLLAMAGLSGVEATIVGDGPDWPLLNLLAEQLKLRGVSVHFTGRLGKDGLHAVLENAHALVLGSSYEGMSHTIVEAMMHGLPAIASDCGGNVELVRDGVDGLIHPFGDVAALIAAIARLRDDETERQTMAAAALARTPEFDFARTVDGTMAQLLDMAR